MIKNVLKFNAEAAFSPIKDEIKFIVDNKNKKHTQLSEFICDVKVSDILCKCKGCHELSQQEKALSDYIKKWFKTKL